MYADRLDEARDRLELALNRARDTGDEFECRNILNHLTQLEIRAGSWIRAEQHARELEELVDRSTSTGHGLVRTRARGCASRPGRRGGGCGLAWPRRAAGALGLGS
jgi:hypothetical protein